MLSFQVLKLCDSRLVQFIKKENISGSFIIIHGIGVCIKVSLDNIPKIISQFIAIHKLKGIHI